MTTNKSTIVSLNATHWEKLSNVLSEHCKRLPTDWEKWGDQIQQIIESNVKNAVQSGSTEKVDVSLNDQNWRTIIDIVTKDCQNRGNDWVDWANRTTSLISNALSPKLIEDINYQLVIEEKSKEIERNPTSAEAYQDRANAYVKLGKPTDALIDISKAIELSPSNPENHRMRCSIYSEAKDWQNYLIDKTKYYKYKGEVDPYEPEKVTDPVSKLLFETVEKHFRSLVYPQLKSTGEVVVEYWPSIIIIWNRETKQVISNGYSFTEEHGNIGSGYICITDQNVRIISIGELAQAFEKQDKGEKKKGAVGRFLVGALSRTNDYSKWVTTDQYWTIPNQTIRGAQVSTDPFIIDKDTNIIKIITPAMTWQILTMELEIVLSALNMALTGKFAEIWQSKSTGKMTQTEILGLIKELGELREHNIITENEFQEKKKELLSRL